MTIQTEQVALDELRTGFMGDIIVPADPAYDEARTIFNAMIDRRPAIIAQCAGVADVVRAVRFGRKLGLEIAVRGGGHSVAGKSLTEGGLVIDLRRMNAVSVNPEARTATVGGGATMGDLDGATQRYGLATTGGRVSTTGVGGYTLGGGDGWLSRKMGLACDNLLSVELVTAEGSVVHASSRENPELFRALHGGGGNFGVATSFTFRLHELSSVTAALLLWRPEAGPEILRAYRDFMESASDEVGGGLLFLTGPREAFVPQHLVGRLALAVLVVYAGPEAETRKAAAAMLALGHEGELIAEMPSASQHVLFPQGGAVGRGPTDYPIPWRQAPWVVHPFGLWTDPADDERARRWARDIRADLNPWSSGAVYLNFIGDEGTDRVTAGFGRENYPRLAKVKAQYDPDNVFHLNHNIKPA